MAALFSSAVGGEVGLQLLLSPTTSSVVIRAACTFVGVGMPVYSTFKAIENKSQEESESWLVYWSAYGCLSIAEIFSDKLLSWFPYYYHAKLLLLIWLQYPGNYGAKYIYSNTLKPFMIAHQATIDKAATVVQNQLTNFMRTNQQEINGVVGAIRRVGGAVAGAARTASSSGATTPGGATTGGTATPSLTMEALPSGSDASKLLAAATSAAQAYLANEGQASKLESGEDTSAPLTNSWIHVQPTTPSQDVPTGAVKSAMDSLRQRSNVNSPGSGAGAS